MSGLSGNTSEITDKIEQRVQPLVAEWQRRSTPHGTRVDPVAIIRKAREKDRDWSQDRSWFGGLPRLGDAAWPRDRKGTPLPFIAQFDLAEIAAAHPDTPLPRAGSLAFFINQGAVIHVPPGDHPPTPAPDDLGPAYQETGFPLPKTRSPMTRQTFPFWPVEPQRMRMPEDLPGIDRECKNWDAIEAAQYAALAQLAPRREFFCSTGTSLTEGIEGIEGAETLWWYAADLVLRQLHAGLETLPAAIATREKWIALAQGYQLRLSAEDEPDGKAIADAKTGEARNHAAIPLIEVQGRRLAEFTARFAGFASGRDPWAVMPEDAVQLLTETIQTAHREFPELCGHTVSFRIQGIRNACIRRMITGDAAAAAAIPDALLALINRDDRLPTSYNHQMFGLGGCPQNAVFDHLCDHLLLQIAYDELPEFGFGDVGLWQFWIAPEDLAAGRWDKVQLTFECG